MKHTVAHKITLGQKAWELLHWKTPLKFLFRVMTEQLRIPSGLLSFTRCFSLPSPVILLPSWAWKPWGPARPPALCTVPAPAPRILRNPVPASYGQTTPCHTPLNPVGKKDKMAVPTDRDQRRGLSEIQHILLNRRRIKSFPSLHAGNGQVSQWTHFDSIL